MKKMRKSAKSKPENGSDLLSRIAGDDTTDQRVVILRSLWQLMLEMGYASTSLTDVAKKAGLSPSHLAYYFRTKEAILVELFEGISNVMLAITNHGDESPSEQCRLLADYAFLESALGTSVRSLAVEMTGIAVHNPRLRRRHEEYVRKTVRYFRDLFAKTPRAFGLSAEDAAFLAMSIWMGLLSSSYFHEGFDQARAQALLRQHLLRLAGLADQHASPDAQLSELNDSRRQDHLGAPRAREESCL